MKTALRFALATTLLCAPEFAMSDWRCHTCQPAPVSVPAPTPVTQNNTYYTYQFVTNGAPYALQGSTVYQAQALDRALVLDQARRLAESASQLAAQGIAGHQQLTYEALALDAQQQLASDEVLMLREIKSLVQELRASRLQQQQQQQLMVAAPSTPLGKLLANRCVKCHSGQQPKGGIDFNNPDNVTLDVLKRAAQAIRNGTMPKDKPLSAEERMLFCEEYAKRLESGN